ncbi:alpha/beta hydrolase [Frankia sp. AgB1.9]|uniref:alpha/beta hydrolase n=1 Tax=unclassified Frankia TaxID=2632575 RepID=UPI001931BBF4|nr:MULTISPECIES: alpha/beta hydrolase [unclassified Frankia]MBL7488495.1 alpha/beta hydrolase [Frankia sp. AgW1.1]MBL7547278.1 alpha/beta hydrolase [Frankia sp. AgB1.9]MBL7620817.1 alpha/beta hydrolase [Frankia sp. AgB1.8]
MSDTGTDVKVIDIRVAVPGTPVGEAAWEIAATVHVLAGEARSAASPVLVLLPGGGYGRRYFDLPDRGYSQADHHARRGTIVVALDHLGAGDSTSPGPDLTTLPLVAAANHAALTAVLERLRDGTLAAGAVPCVEISAVVGAGQSMGGHIAAAMQAQHRTFDAIALMGSSVIETTIPRRQPAASSVVPDQARTGILADLDWPWAFHWVEELSPLAAADIEAGIPVKTAALPWSSMTVPSLAVTLLEPGAIAAEVAAVDVPVLLVAGERDVVRPLLTEAAAFTSARDLAVFRLRRMAHMHNFAPTRHLLWERLDAFIAQAAGLASTSKALSTPTAAELP